MPAQQSEAARESFYSAAMPCTPTPESTYLQTDLPTLLAETKRAFNAKALSEILTPIEPLILPTQPKVATFYTVSPNFAQTPIVFVGFGYGANVVDAVGIFWYENGGWKAQPYPPAEPELAQQRNQVLSQGKFCGGLVTGLYKSGNLIAVVNDLGRNGTRSAQEVQLLALENRVWKIVWAPTYQKWETLWNARVEPQENIDSFVVHREDIKNPEHQWQEVWKLEGKKYVRVEPAPNS